MKRVQVLGLELGFCRRRKVEDDEGGAIRVWGGGREERERGEGREG